jgi:hypothetical protein
MTVAAEFDGPVDGRTAQAWGRVVDVFRGDFRECGAARGLRGVPARLTTDP